VGGNHRPLWMRRKQEGRLLPKALAPCALLEVSISRKHAKIKMALFRRGIHHLGMGGIGVSGAAVAGEAAACCFLGPLNQTIGDSYPCLPEFSSVCHAYEENPAARQTCAQRTLPRL
jgi:hypothetical protein